MPTNHAPNDTAGRRAMNRTKEGLTHQTMPTNNALNDTSVQRTTPTNEQRERTLQITVWVWNTVVTNRSENSVHFTSAVQLRKNLVKKFVPIVSGNFKSCSRSVSFVARYRPSANSYFVKKSTPFIRWPIDLGCLSSVCRTFRENYTRVNILPHREKMFSLVLVLRSFSYPADTPYSAL